MELLKKIGKNFAVFLAAGEIIGQILGFLLIPALIVVCGLLNGYEAAYYCYALGIYLVIFLTVRLISRLIGKKNRAENGNKMMRGIIVLWSKAFPWGKVDSK